MKPVMNWWNDRKAFIFLAVAFAFAVGLSACGKGFGNASDDKAKVTAGTPSLTVNPNVTVMTADGQNVSPFVIMAMKDAAVAAIVNAPANKGKVQASIKAGIKITTLEYGKSAGKDSELNIEVTVKGVDGKTATTNVINNNAEIGLYTDDTQGVADRDPDIYGYWTLQLSNQPFYVGLRTNVVPGANGTLLLQGNLLTYSGGKELILADLNGKNICEFVIDPWSWASQLYEEGTFKGCPK